MAVLVTLIVIVTAIVIVIAATQVRTMARTVRTHLLFVLLIVMAQAVGGVQLAVVQGV